MRARLKYVKSFIILGSIFGVILGYKIVGNIVVGGALGIYIGCLVGCGFQILEQRKREFK